MILLEELGMKSNKSGNRYRYGKYQCPSCDEVNELCTHNVKRQNAKAIEAGIDSLCVKCTLKRRNTSHGFSKRGDSKGYHMYKNMINRCYREDVNNYHNYGGRGIKVCDEWFDDMSFFIEWFNDNYIDGYEIDRIDNDGDYSPDNCRFVSKSDNAKNRRDKASRKSKYRYVMWNKDRQKWFVNAPYLDNGVRKRKYLGLYIDEEDAYKAILSFDNVLDALKEELRREYR